MPDVDVWPDNWHAVNVFNALGTQWRSGYGGPTGLDYGVIRSTLSLMGVPRKEWSELFDLIQVMEVAALKEIHG